jgi:hypothetical protein
MRRFWGVLPVVVICLITGAAGSAWAVTGQPTIYNVTVKMVELSPDGGTTWVVIGSGDQSMDIADVDAGAKAADYVSGADLPYGTYTTMRTTISSTFGLRTPLAGLNGEAGGNYAGTPLFTSGSPSAGCFNCTNVAGDVGTVDIAIPAGTVMPAGMTLDAVAGTITILQDLNVTASPDQNPVIRISFDVSTALETVVVAGLTDVIVPNPPTVTVTQS